MAKKENMFEISAGEPVGVIAAQSLGEPATQMVLKAFHFAGLKSEIATAGLPRFVEIVDAKKKPATPFTYIAVDKSIAKDEQKLIRLAKKISEIKVSDISRRIVEEFSKGTIILRLDFEKLEANELTAKVVASKIEKLTKLSCTLEGMDVRITAGTRNIKQIRNMAVQLNKMTINGIDGAGRAAVREDPKTKELQLITDNSSLSGLLDVEGIDAYNIYTNDIFEEYRVFGVEAARNAIITELEKLLHESEISVSRRHLELLADAMTADGDVKNVGRRGLSGEKESVFARAAYEETVKHLINAAAFGESDPMQGVTENILMGKQIMLGTGRVELAVKKEDIAKSKKEKK